MIPVDLSVNCDGRIYDPNGSGIQIIGIRSRIRFRDPRTCLASTNRLRTLITNTAASTERTLVLSER